MRIKPVGSILLYGAFCESGNILNSQWAPVRRLEPTRRKTLQYFYFRLQLYEISNPSQPPLVRGGAHIQIP